MAKRLLRRREAFARTGKSTSAGYRDIADGLFPPGVRIGPQSVAWPEDEVDEVITARIAGKLVGGSLHCRERWLGQGGNAGMIEISQIFGYWKLLPHGLKIISGVLTHYEVLSLKVN